MLVDETSPSDLAILVCARVRATCCALLCCIVERLAMLQDPIVRNTTKPHQWLQLRIMMISCHNTKTVRMNCSYYCMTELLCCLAVMPRVSHTGGGNGDGLFSGMTVSISDRFPSSAREAITTEVTKHGGTTQHDFVLKLQSPQNNFFTNFVLLFR